MLKVVVVGVLSLVLLCMIPIMGGTPHHSIDLSMLLLLLSLLGLAMVIVPVLPKLVPPHSPFHPPRFQS